MSQPKVFHFPDDTQRLGAVSLERHDGESERLRGTVSLGAVKPGQPVTGTLRLERESGGAPIERTFRATWGRTQARCGLALFHRAYFRSGVY